mmetsp:Transcript_22266/g.51427  ORF Transcript_22266/g.51427 Transcript_22266/m.51427 type:complete len:230 (-) Transcript_22266:24-713(-)
MGPREPLDGLRAQYASNPGFLPKIDGLGRRFAAIRRTRPDGNCFYRAYLYGIFEAIVGKAAPLTEFAARAKASLDFCLGAGYERVALEDFHEEFVSCIERLAAEGASASTVDEVVAECDGFLICWARCLTSAYLKIHAEEYVAFLSSHSSIAEFCAQEVDPMQKDADHLQIVALSSYFGVPVCVVYLDRSDGDKAAEHVFQEGGKSDCPFETVHLLYRPGHYDLIYPLR